MTDESATETHLYETIPEDELESWWPWVNKWSIKMWGDLPEVELSGDTITLNWGPEWWSDEPIVAKIDECHYRVGRAWQMKLGTRKTKRFFPFGSFELILIDFPPLHKTVFGRTWSYTTVPVGYTEESLAAWNVALGDVFGSYGKSLPDRNPIR